MKLFRTKTFKKDYQKLKTSDDQYAKYIKYLYLHILRHNTIPLNKPTTQGHTQAKPDPGFP